MDAILGIILCVTAIAAVIKSFFSGRGMSSVATWIAILLLLPGILMVFSGANLDTFLGSLPVIGPVLGAFGLISAESSGSDWVEFILTVQISCLIGFTCWGADGFFENLVMKIIIAGASYIVLVVIKYFLASAIPGWVDIGMIAVMLLLFFVLYNGKLLPAFLWEIVIVFAAIGILSALLAGSVVLSDIVAALLSPILTIALIALAIVLILK